MNSGIRNYIKKMGLNERDHFASRPTHRPPLMRFWAFHVQSLDVQSFIIIEEETQQEAIDSLPTRDLCYSRNDLLDIDYNIQLGKDIVRQSWIGPDNKRIHLDFHLLDYFYSRNSAEDHIKQIKKEKTHRR